MHFEQRQRVHEFLQDKGIAQALFAYPASVGWLTGFVPPVQVGANPFAGGPPLVWYDDGRFTLITVDSFAAETGTFDKEHDCTGITYPGYQLEKPIDGGGGLREAVETAVFNHTPGKDGRIGIELQAVPAAVVQQLQTLLPAANNPIAIDGWLAPLRMVKTDEELVKLRANFALTDLGHATARRTVSAGLPDTGLPDTGRREIDVWTAVHQAIENAAGERVPLGNDCVVGYREANIGGWPLDYEIRAGDSLIVDLSTLRYGYWSDSCATYFAGTPTAVQTEIHQVVSEALALGISLVRPGAVAREIDRQVRKFITDAGYPAYPHHTGHGVGLMGHEAPRIVPYSDEVLQPGMVIMLEPGIYLPGKTGVRLEDALLVTEDGAELLTHHDKRLPG